MEETWRINEIEKLGLASLKEEKCESLFVFWHNAMQQKSFFAKRRDLTYWENIRMDPRANNGAVGGANEDGKPIGGINRDSMVCSMNSVFRNVIFMIKALTSQWDVIRFNELDLGMFLSIYFFISLLNVQRLFSSFILDKLLAKSYCSIRREVTEISLGFH